MQPIHELLNRIRWDKEFGRGQFEIGYLDRHKAVIQKVWLERITFPEGNRRVFDLADEAGQMRRIPFHRVREVLRDGEVIWKRPVLSFEQRADNALECPKAREQGNSQPERFG